MKTYEEMLLLTPGPVQVPHKVLEASSRPILHHRTDEASRLISGVLEKLKDLLGTKQEVLPVHTTGRGAMEGTIVNLFSPGDEIISICNGKFGSMYAEIAEIHGLKVHRVCEDWLRPIDLDEVAQAIAAHTHAKALTICHSDTSTACLNDLQASARLARQSGLLVVVDAISSVGCTPVEFDAWGLDALVTASQKGLMSPPGVSFVVLSEAAWQAVDTARCAKFYIGYRDIQKNLHGKRAETPGTTPISLLAGVNAALDIIMEEGKENCYARHARLAAALRSGLAAAGLALFPAGVEGRSPALTAVQTTPVLHDLLLRELKSEWGISVASGLGAQYKKTVLRIGHMGNVYPRDIVALVAAVEGILLQAGAVDGVGKGVAACLQVLMERE